MAFILPAVLLIGFILIGLWWLFFGATLRQEWEIRAAQRREADFERLLTVPEEPLFCVSCQQMFAGPLGSEGCPTCHIRALVLPASTSADPKVVEQGRQFTARRTAQPQTENVPENSVRTMSESVSPSPEILPQGKIYK